MSDAWIGGRNAGSSPVRLADATRDRVPTVAVIGAGPAGLLAAWGAIRGGGDVTIYDRDIMFNPERVFSLQYMHEACDLEAHVRRIKLRYYLMGILPAYEEWRLDAARMYNAKLGRSLDEPNSVRFIKPFVNVWSLRDAYTYLRHQLAPLIVQRFWTWENIVNDLASSFDFVINTAPLDKLLPDRAWPIRSGTIALGWTPIILPPDACIYNVEAGVPWYRATRLDGGLATEFTGDPIEKVRANVGWKVEVHHLRKVAAGAVLPDRPSNVLLTGRWGSWNPEGLTHNAFRDSKLFVELKGRVHG